jgi:hypothetical protein
VTVTLPMTPHDYRHRATECERLAENGTSAANREVLLGLAKRWRSLADEDEIKTKPRTPAPDQLPPSE